MSTTAHDTIDKTTQDALAGGRTFVWHEVYGPSDGASIDFYTKAFGWGSEDYDMGPGGKYRMLTKDGVGIAGAWGTTGKPEMQNVPPHWAVYIGCDDVDAQLKKC